MLGMFRPRKSDKAWLEQVRTCYTRLVYVRPFYEILGKDMPG
jgi:hypothetical protein